MNTTTVTVVNGADLKTNKERGRETMTAQDRYRQALTEMTVNELLDELTHSVNRNDYGSHDEQIAMIRQAIHARTN